MTSTSHQHAAIRSAITNKETRRDFPRSISPWLSSDHPHQAILCDREFPSLDVHWSRQWSFWHRRRRKDHTSPSIDQSGVVETVVRTRSTRARESPSTKTISPEYSAAKEKAKRAARASPFKGDEPWVLLRRIRRILPLLSRHTAAAHGQFALTATSKLILRAPSSGGVYCPQMPLSLE